MTHEPSELEALQAEYDALEHEHRQLQRRVEKALEGLDNAGVHEGTTARILRGTANA